MPISFQCPECAKPFNLGDELAGKKARCGCGAVIQVPQPAVPTQQQPVDPLPGPLSSAAQLADPLMGSVAPAQPLVGPLTASYDQKDVDAGRDSNKKLILIGAGVGAGLGVMVIALLFMILGGDDSNPTTDGENKPTTNATADVDLQQVDSNSSVQNSPAVRPLAPGGGTVASLASPAELPLGNEPITIGQLRWYDARREGSLPVMAFDYRAKQEPLLKDVHLTIFLINSDDRVPVGLPKRYQGGVFPIPGSERLPASGTLYNGNVVTGSFLVAIEIQLVSSGKAVSNLLRIPIPDGQYSQLETVGPMPSGAMTFSSRGFESSPR